MPAIFTWGKKSNTVCHLKAISCPQPKQDQEMPNFAVPSGVAAWATGNLPASRMSFFISRLKTASRSHLTQLIVLKHSNFLDLILIFLCTTHSTCFPVKCSPCFLGQKTSVFSLQGVFILLIGAQHSSVPSASKHLPGSQGLAAWNDRDQQSRGAPEPWGQMSDPNKSRDGPSRKQQTHFCQTNRASECA